MRELRTGLDWITQDLHFKHEEDEEEEELNDYDNDREGEEDDKVSDACYHQLSPEEDHAHT